MLPPGSPYTPLYEAQNSARYERQSLIREYQSRKDCNLVVVSSTIFPFSVVFFEELIHNVDPQKDLHVMLASPGGNGETALRLIRSAQQRSRQVTVVVPDQAKSAATLFCLGAHQILMGPSSDFGPIDPQFSLDDKGTLVSAKDIIAAVEDATERVQRAPETYPLWASLLSNVTALMVQQARSAILRSGDLLRHALQANPDRTEEEVAKLVENLQGKLIVESQTHAAVFGSEDAQAAGLPVRKLDPSGEEWREIWRLWSRYVVLPQSTVYEGAQASQMF